MNLVLKKRWKALGLEIVAVGAARWHRGRGLRKPAADGNGNGNSDGQCESDWRVIDNNGRNWDDTRRRDDDDDQENDDDASDDDSMRSSAPSVNLITIKFGIGPIFYILISKARYNSIH